MGPAAQLGFRGQPSWLQAGSTSPVVVEIRDAGGNPVTVASADNSVSLVLAGGTSGAHLLGSSQLAATNGVASFTGVSVDSAGTGFVLRANAIGLTSATSSAFNVTPGDATRLLFISAPPAQVVAGAPIAVQVALVDAFGNLSVQSGNQVSLILGGVGTTQGGSLLGTTTQAPSSGTAAFSVRVRKAAAAYTLRATASGLTDSPTATFDVVAGARSRLGFAQQPTGAAPGANIAPAATVEVRDSADNLVAAATNAVALAITPGSGTASATLNGTVTQTATAGIATFGDLSIATAGSNYTLTARATSLDSAVSTAFSIVTVEQDRPVFTSIPSSVTAGTPFSVVVQIQDGQGNVTARTDSVAVAIAAGTGNADATLRGNHLKVAAVAGVAAFPDLTIDSVGAGYALTATVTGLPVATSAATFTVSAGAPQQLRFRTQPTSRSAGNVIVPGVEVMVLDSVGNLATSATDSITMGITLGTGKTGATLRGTLGRRAVAGVASFADLSIDSAGTGYTLTGSAASRNPAVSNAFSIAVGALTRVVVTPAGVTLTGAGATATLIAVPRDSVGNAVSAAVTWTSLNPNVATVNASTGVVTAVGSGQATIAATSEGKNGYAVVTVTAAASAPVNLWTPDASGATETLEDFWGTSPSDLWVVNSQDGNPEVHRTGTTWQTVDIGASRPVNGIGGTSAGDIIAVGNVGLILHWNGSAWLDQSVSDLGHLMDVWAAAPNDAWAVGGAYGPLVFHYDGAAWTKVPVSGSSTSALFGVWGASALDVYAVGDNGSGGPRILHYDGTSWTDVASVPGSGLLNYVWGTASNDVFAVGAGGLILHYDGTSWSATTSPTTRALHAVGGTTGSDVYAAGNNGALLRYEGATWQTMPAPDTTYLRGIWTTTSGPAFASGYSGTLWRGYRGATVTVSPASPSISVAATQQLTATAKDATDATISGVTFTWTSSNTGVATVSSSGLVTGVAAGAATITAAAPGGVAGSTTVTVTP